MRKILDLVNPLPWDDLTPAQRQLVVPEAAHELSARHRYAYWVGGPAEARTLADDQLLEGLLELARRTPAGWLRRLGRKAEAWFVWATFRLFGGTQFAYGRQRGMWDLMLLTAAYGIDNGDCPEDAFELAADAPRLVEEGLKAAQAVLIVEAEEHGDVEEVL